MLFDSRHRLEAHLLDGSETPRILVFDSVTEKTTLYRLSPTDRQPQTIQSFDHRLEIDLSVPGAMAFSHEDMSWVATPDQDTLLGPIPSPKEWFRCQSSAGWLTVSWGDDFDRRDEMVRYDDELRVVRRLEMPLDPDDPKHHLRDFRGLDAKDHLIVKGHEHLWVIDDEGRATKLVLPFDPQGLGFSGRRGLALFNSSRLLETADYGRTWTEVENPGWLSEELRILDRISCEEVGCHTPWGYRLGWLLR